MNPELRASFEACAALAGCVLPQPPPEETADDRAPVQEAVAPSPPAPIPEPA